MRSPEKKEPRLAGRSSLDTKAAGAAFDPENSRNLLNRQAAVLVARFRLPAELALTVAELAFEHGRAGA